MEPEKGKYFNLLSSGALSVKVINQIPGHMSTLGLTITPITQDMYGRNDASEKITDYLTRLPLYLVEGNPSWEGLLVGFPGDKKELSTKSVGTPYLRVILYPILDLHHRLQNLSKKRLPCIYFVGDRFSDVFLRKFFLLREVIPHIVVLTNDLYQCAQNKSQPPVTEKIFTESWTQMKISKQMSSEHGQKIQSGKRETVLRFLSSEVPCSEGTENPERLDVLGYDGKDHSIVAFELKGPGASRVELENLFLQGVEHRNWLENNKMAIKLLFDGGPRGRRINTKKRVRLYLGFYGEFLPAIFNELKHEAIRRDPYTEIEFIKLVNENDGVTLRSMLT